MTHSSAHTFAASMPISELTRQQEEAQRKAIERYLEDGSTVQVRVSKRRRSRRSGAGAERAKVVEAPPSPIPEEAAPGGPSARIPEMVPEHRPDAGGQRGKSSL